MYRTIVVPLDGSVVAEAALPLATRLAHGPDTVLLLVHALGAPDAQSGGCGGGGSGDGGQSIPRPRGSAARTAIEPYLRRTAAVLAAGGTRVEMALVPGAPAPAVVQAAQARCADLVVMGTHARSALGRLVFGSVADEVLRHAPAPLVFVPPSCPALARGCDETKTRPAVRRVIVPLDGSHLALAAIGPARAAACALGAQLLLLRVVEPPSTTTFHAGVRSLLFHPEAAVAGAERYLRSVGTLAHLADTPVETCAAIGEPAAAIAAAAQERGAVMIAMATHGRGGAERVLLGSVAADTVRLAHLPVLLVRPGVRGVPPAGASEWLGAAARH